MHQIEHFELATPCAVSLALRAGSNIRVSHGRLWLTRPGYPEDRWLQAGDCWTLPATGRVWLGAEPVAQFQISRALTPWRLPGLAPLRRFLPWLDSWAGDLNKPQNHHEHP